MAALKSNSITEHEKKHYNIFIAVIIVSISFMEGGGGRVGLNDSWTKSKGNFYLLIW